MGKHQRLSAKHPSSAKPSKKIKRTTPSIINPVTLSFGLLIALALTSALVHPEAPAIINPQPVPSPTIIPTPTPLPYPLPFRTDSALPPWFTARGVIVIDRLSGTVLYEKNADAQLLPASTTKMMTALVALDQYSPADLVTVTNGNESIGHKAELSPGEIYTVEDLLYALLLDSGNDAAVTLAQHHPQGYTAFIEQMNAKAQSLGFKNTHFTNASGIESPYHYASARDLVNLATVLLENPLLAKIVDTRTKNITDLKYKHSHLLNNTNELLGKIPGVQGVKTGWTELAGDCLVTLVDRENHPIIMVLLGSTDRFGETAKLIEWIYQNYRWGAVEG
jgi:D-alanyl-D-alanine carboxypeptidase (penicillin-binding protein 5/6)